MTDELTQARETIRRLNRRVQEAESALVEKLDEAKRSGGSLGRALLSWGYSATSARLNEVAMALDGMRWDDLPVALHRFRPAAAKHVRASDLTDIRENREPAPTPSDNTPSNDSPASTPSTTTET